MDGLPKESLPLLVQWKMPFGKYKGTLLADLPIAYLEWFQRKGFPDGKLGDLLQILYQIKLNGLEEILWELKRIESLKS